MRAFIYNDKKTKITTDTNIYPQDVLEYSIYSELVYSKIFNITELLHIRQMSSQTFMMHIS